MDAPKSVAVLLRTAGAIPAHDYQRAREAACAARCTVLEGMVLLRLIDELAVADLVSAHARVPRVAAQLLENPRTTALEALPGEVQAEWGVIPFALDSDGYLHVAMRDPLLDSSLQEIQFFAGRRLIRYVATPTEIAAALYVHHGAQTPIYEHWLSSRLRQAPRRRVEATPPPIPPPRRASGRQPRVLRLTPVPS